MDTTGRRASGWHYLDHAASTPMHPDAIDAMVAYLPEGFGNPSGSHALARVARADLDRAREQLASVVGCHPGEVVFTSGGTEADNLAVRGAVEAHGGTAACLASDHHAVLHAVERAGGRIVPVDHRGVVDLERLTEMVDPSVSVVSVALVNNEIGTIQPLDRIAEVVRERAPEALLHVDAAQALCWLDLRTQVSAADLVTLVSHKCGGPRGMGALVVRSGARLAAQQVGGGQERDLRSGTQDVASAVSFAVAARSADAERSGLVARAGSWRDALVASIRAGVDGAVESANPLGDQSHLVPGIVNVCLPAVDSEAVLFLLEDRYRVLASAASSCASGAQEPSHVLAAIGVERSSARGSLRLSFGWSTTDDDVTVAARAVPEVANQLRAHSRGGAPA